MDGLLLKNDMMNFFSQNSSGFRIFPDFPDFLKILKFCNIIEIMLCACKSHILYDRIFRDLSVFRIFLGIFEI